LLLKGFPSPNAAPAVWEGVRLLPAEQRECAQEERAQLDATFDDDRLSDAVGRGLGSYIGRLRIPTEP